MCEVNLKLLTAPEINVFFNSSTNNIYETALARKTVKVVCFMNQLCLYVLSTLLIKTIILIGF